MSKVISYLHEHVPNVENGYGNVELVPDQTEVFFQAVKLRLPKRTKVSHLNLFSR